MANLDEVRALLLSLQAQIDQDAKATPAATAGDVLPELADKLADGLVHPLELRDVLLHLDARLIALEAKTSITADAPDAPDAPVKPAAPVNPDAPVNPAAPDASKTGGK